MSCWRLLLAAAVLLQLSAGQEAAAEGVAEASPKLSSSFDELQEKLEVLKDLLGKRDDPASKELMDLLSKKGGAAEQGLLEKIQNLKKDFGLLDEHKKGEDGGTVGVMGACIALTATRSSRRKRETAAVVRALAANTMTRAQAAENAIVRTLVSCMLELTNDEYERFRRGSITELPGAIVKKAESPEAGKQVLSLEDGLWDELRGVAEMFEAQGFGVEEEEGGFATGLGLLAAVPVLGAVVFLAKKFLDLQQQKAQPKKAKGSKKS